MSRVERPDGGGTGSVHACLLMNLAPAAALERLAGHDHGVLATIHATRGVDLVPVVYAVADGHVGIPVDEVKAKTSGRLQREHNLDADPRATLLVEHWDRADWSTLWWVRAQLHGVDADPRDDGEPGGDCQRRDLAAALADGLAERFVQYREHPFARILVLRIERVVGWTAGG